ncbi:hypothetical protein JCM10207_001819 [Rhodosporidiobolus poonsookiae]
MPTISSTKLTSDPNWSYQGCYAKYTSSSKTIPNLLTRNGWTIESCVTAAASAGYSVASLIGGGECWAANALSSATATLDASACQATCNDNRLETCGGEHGFDVYFSTAKPPVAQTTNGNLATFGDWKYDACYADLVNGRTLGATLNNANKTIEGCLNACKASGYNVCGLEWYGECWGSEALSWDAKHLDESKCSTTCSGNSAQTCGGDAALGIWRKGAALVKPTTTTTTTTASPTTTTTTTTTTTAPAGPTATHYSNDKWTYKGCYKQIANKDKVSGMTTVTSMGGCTGVLNGQSSSQIYAVMSGNDCRGQKTLGNAVKVDDSECNVPCSGDALQLCGNSNKDNLCWEVLERVPTSTTTTQTTTTTTTTAPAAPTAPAKSWTVHDCTYFYPSDLNKTYWFTRLGSASQGFQSCADAAKAAGSDYLIVFNNMYCYAVLLAYPLATRSVSNAPFCGAKFPTGEAAGGVNNGYSSVYVWA